MKKIFVMTALLAVASAAHAGEGGISAAKREKKAMLSEFQKGRMEGFTQKALNAIVARGVAELRKHGHEADAAAYEQDWNVNFSNYLTGTHAMDLGDHAPLSQWLADFYVKLEAKLGEWIMKQTNLVDIKVFNFGIPVTLQPKGDRRNGDTWDIDEYRLHFVPTSAATMYWVVKQACKAAGVEIPFVCGIVAGLFKTAMTKYIGPKLSDIVYKKANGIKQNDYIDPNWLPQELATVE